MSDFDLDWGMEHDLHVDHDGGVDHVQADDHHTFYDHDYSDGDADHTDHADQHEAPQDAIGLDEQEPDLPEWQLDTDFLDGHYDTVGADPDENDMWSQFMTEMHEEINPYAAN